MRPGWVRHIQVPMNNCRDQIGGESLGKKNCTSEFAESCLEQVQDANVYNLTLGFNFDWQSTILNLYTKVESKPVKR